MWEWDSDTDSDDDFQNPIQAIPLTQTAFLSSRKNGGSKPLSPSNGRVRPRKKPKPSASTGKENLSVAKNQKWHSGIPVCTALKETVEGGHGAEREDLSVDSRHFPPNGSIGAHELEKDSLLGSSGHEASRERHDERKDGASDECVKIKGSKWEGDGCYAASMKARLLTTGKACPCLDEHELGQFEPSTQLNELMNLCLEMDGGEDPGDGAEFPGREDLDDGEIAWQSDGLVECPLCGLDITNVSEEQRHAHTNDCLDNDCSSKVNISNDENNPMPKSASVVSQVLDFLRALGLSKYEEAFIKEEIDWDMLQWLTEEDLLGIGVIALGPRKKILHALNELRSEKTHDDVHTNTNGPRIVTEQSMKVSPRNKLITEYFQGSSVSRTRAFSSSKSSHPVDNSNKCDKGTISRRATVRNCSGNSRLRDAPSWCCIPGTPFRVDAFRFLKGYCLHWFLTHFHIDHYQGLTKNFRHGKIYCSPITAKLVSVKIGVPLDRLHILPLNERIDIAGVTVTFLDANHCPGSVIILFEPPNGKAVLHTGDFRFCEAMANCCVLQSCRVHTLILDTTYCNPLYDFPKQEAIIQFVIEAIQAEAFNPKTLFLIGSYTVGKERLFCEVARFLRKKVFVGAAKLRLLQCLGLPEEDMQWFTLNEMESNIHVVPMWTIASFKRMKHLSNQYSGRYNLIVAFSPTGWSFGKGKKKSGAGRKWQQGTVIRYEVPYSEHSNFSELQDFVRFISPEIIIPSVNSDSQESADAMVSLLMSQHTQSGNAF